MRRVVLLGCLLLALNALAESLPPWQAGGQLDHPQLGRVLDTASGDWLTPQQLLLRLAGVERLLLGEKHDNPDHQALQLWLLQQLHGLQPRQSLLLEMLTPSQLPKLQALRPGDAGRDDLQQRLDWGSGWDWQAYSPLIRWGLLEDVSLHTANLDRDEILRLYQQPPLLQPVYSPVALERLRTTIAESHCRRLPDAQVEAMLAIQQARDQAMAAALQRSPAPSVLVAGSFHVRRDLGVPLYLDDEQPLLRVLVFHEAGQKLPGLEQADYVWLTPAVAAQDYCAGMAEAN